jgi:transaldolase
MNQLDSLKSMTTIVADTGEFEEIQAYRPTDATTNPSLIFAAAQKEEYQHLLDDAILYGKNNGTTLEEKLHKSLDKAFVKFGLEILKIVPGRVSTEVDARLSFDIEGSLHKARTLISMYEAAGIDRARILIKLASTWEGTRAAEILEKEGIHCNMTLLFSLPQAIACSDVRATLISPFVGRILDWHKKNEGVESYPPQEDPGVQSVTQIFNYFKKFDSKTQIMGASFRNIDEILELAGCDLLTIAPKFLKVLQETSSEVPLKLDAEKTHAMDIKKLEINEKTFRWLLCNDPMALDKLHEGIRLFTQDILKLEQEIAKRGKFQ